MELKSIPIFLSHLHPSLRYDGSMSRLKKKVSSFLRDYLSSDIGLLLPLSKCNSPVAVRNPRQAPSRALEDQGRLDGSAISSYILIVIGKSCRGRREKGADLTPFPPSCYP